MANLETTSAPGFTPAASGIVPGLLISLGPLADHALQTTLANVDTAFPGQSVLVASPGFAETRFAETGAPAGAGGQVPQSIELLPYTPAAPSSDQWVLSAADYLSTYKLAKEHQAATCLLLGAEAQSLHPGALRDLALAATRADLAVACYDLGPREGLVNSAILYPVSRAIYGARPRFPLALDLGFSLRMAERLATAAQKFTAAGQNDALIWPIAEAASANYSLTEVQVGPRTIPQPGSHDLNSLLAQITGSLFSDVELKASYWQRARGTQPPRPRVHSVTDVSMPHVEPMLDAFRIAYTNLHEIWSLVLPPNSLLGLKRLSQVPPASFRMADALWARIVYDFILAWRLRTINRGHLLGALTPLYLAWVASHILLVDGGTAPEDHIEEQAVAFETDKPYLVSRWRWPDRFNP